MSFHTCLTCGVKFVGNAALAAETQKEHFRSDWHVYNLKRKEASLAPVSAEVFNEKVLSTKQENNRGEENSGWHCSPCRKKFASEKAFQNHLGSKKHLLVEQEKNETSNLKEFKVKTSVKTTTEVEEFEDDMEVEEVSDEDWESEPLPLEECLFCDLVSEDMESNVQHMVSCHGFFVPYNECVVNLEGLMHYLAEKIGQFHVCLWCYSSNFYEVRAVKSHMMDKGHCMIKFDDDNPEYSPFYDYKKLPQSFKKHEDQLQIVLPSGAVLGHRELFNYYKQKVNIGRELALFGGSSSSNIKKIGWVGEKGLEAIKRAKAMKVERRLRSRELLKIGVKANKLQKHYRDQVFGF